MEQFGNPSNGEQYRQALRSTRAAKNVFFWLIFLALAVQLAGFVLVRIAKVLDEPEKSADPVTTATAPAEAITATAPSESTETPETNSSAWRAMLKWAMPAAKFAALASGILLVLTLLLAVKLALLGRTPGVPGLLSAFFWSLLLWVMLVPWQQALPESSLVCGAMSNLGELMDDTAALAEAGWLTHAIYYARFVAYPVLALVLLLLVQAKFARGYRQAVGAELAESPAASPAGKI